MYSLLDNEQQAIENIQDAIQEYLAAISESIQGKAAQEVIAISLANALPKPMMNLG